MAIIQVPYQQTNLIFPGRILSAICEDGKANENRALPTSTDEPSS